jgi:hypothetical protein
MTFALIKEILRRIEAQATNEEKVSFELFPDGSWRFNIMNLSGFFKEGSNEFSSDTYASFSDLMDDLREKS